MTSLRQTLLANGYSPTANRGKACFIPKWPTVEITPEVIDRWGRRHSRYQDTGLRIENGLAVADLDVNHPIAEKILDAWEAEIPALKGALLRYGKGHKLALFYRTTEAFSRIHSYRFTAPGENVDEHGTHVIEIFGGAASRQFGAFGAHTRADNGEVLVEYEWTDGSPLDTPLDQLPELDKATQFKMVDIAERVLRAAGFEQVLKTTKGESEAHRVYDLVDDMTFETAEGFDDVPLAEIEKQAQAKIEGLRVSASFIEPGRLHSRTRCLVGLSGSGQLTIWDSATHITHMRAELKAAQEERQLDASLLAEKLRRLAEAGSNGADRRELRQRAQLDANDDYDAALEKALNGYAFCPANGRQSVVPIWASSPDEGMAKTTFQDLLDPYARTSFTRTGIPKRHNPADAWRMSKARIDVAGLRMRPDKPWPLFTDNEGQWINTYARPHYTATPTGQDVFTAFLEHLIPDATERDYFLDALAHKLRHPDVPGPGLLMVSPLQGAGRGTLFAMLQQLYGSQYVRKVDPVALTGDGTGQSSYNTWLASSTVVLVDELVNPGDGNVFWRRRRTYDRIKSLIDPSPREVEIIRKTLPNYPARTFTTFIMATNNANALPLDEDDRRICVLRNGGKLADNPALSAKLNSYRENGGFTEGFIAGVAAVLEARALDGFDAYAPPPLFAGKVNMIDRNMTEIAEAADAVLAELPGDFITRKAFLDRVRRKLREVHDDAFPPASHKHLAAEACERIDREWVSMGRVKINEKENKAEVWARHDDAVRRWKGVSWAEREGSLAINGDPLRKLAGLQARARAGGLSVVAGGKCD